MTDFGVDKLKFEDGLDEATVSKRIIISGDNLLDAQPRWMPKLIKQ